MRLAEAQPSVVQVGRVAAGLLAPVVIPVLALVLHQAGVVTIPWAGGAVAVVIVAGFVCGVLVRSTWAAGRIFLVWLVWAVVGIASDDGTADPPANVMALAMLIILAVPAMVAAFVGLLVARALQLRGT